MGASELKALWGLVGSNISLVISVSICIMGLYQWLVKGNTGWGITLLVLSMFLPFFTNIINGIQTALCPIIKDLAGPSACVNFTTGGGSNSNLQI